MVEAAGSPPADFSGGMPGPPSAAPKDRLHRVMLGGGAALLLCGGGLGLLALVLALVAAWFGGPQLTTTEFPLGHPVNVAVDSQGRIYVAENFYGRVQR